jgi:D-alanyl-D-alanine carboxypeptidase/D-alanyl-D-alanine-endopeptidase (penicillin-binding protein 4)
MDNRSLTSRRWRGSTLQIDRSFESNELVLTGSVARSYSGTVGVPVGNPTVFALNAFVTYLREAGIETDLEVHDIDDLSRRPQQGEALFVHLSPPLSDIVSVVNKESNNFYAEQIFRTYGWGGSTRGAARRTDAFLRRSRINTGPVEVYDGSGLSRKNLTTPAAMVDLLRHMDDHPARDAFRASLPGGGENNTTLEYRLSREPVMAKTGSLRYVRTLSGYAMRPDGSRVAFAIFANNYTGPSYQITRTIDDVVRALTRP